MSRGAKGEGKRRLKGRLFYARGLGRVGMKRGRCPFAEGWVFGFVGR